MVKSLVSKLSSASSNISLASTLSSVSASMHGVGSASGSGVQETNYLKHRNDPGRFFGDGVQFKAKLIGILEVGEARGDRMCQEALQDLKMAIRAAGEHKQRITIHVTIDGLRLRDEKTGDSLYHHPVHKISFIAQDMTDSRAFGYIFGSPDSGHRFFGIKTDKAASQVVLAMRDLFQVVFELKKKEIELARQQIQSKSIHDHQTLSSLASLKTTVTGHNDLSGGAGPSSLSMLSSFSAGAAGNSMKMGYGSHDAKVAMNSNIKEMSPESVADLVDLEQELSSIQRGITQMERITPNDSTPTLGCSSNSKTTGMDEDPFGDSFTNFPTYNLLPPPESSRSRAKPNKPPESNNINIKTSAAGGESLTATNVATISMLATTAVGTLSSSASPANVQQDDDDSWLNELDQQNDVFDTSKAGMMGIGVGMSSAPLAPSESTATPPNSQLLAGPSGLELPAATTTAITATSDAISIGSQSDQAQSLLQAVKSDAFTDLDPLGTGRTRPYVDKKYFFQELKNPPKKVLKDLSTTAFNNTNGSNNNIALDNVSIDELMQKVELFDLTASSAPESAAVTTTTTMQTAARTFEQSSYSQTHHAPPSSAHQKVTNTLTGTIGSAAELISLTATTTTATTKTTKPTPISSAINTNISLATSTTSSITTKPFKLQFPTTSSFANQTNFNLNNYNLDSCPAEVEGTADATLTTGTGADPVMLPRDTDPFSPTRKKSDPFQEGDLFSNMDPFEFEFTASAHEATKSIQQQEQQNQRSSPAVGEARKSADVFNGPLQVSLPPESATPTPVLNASGMGNNTSARSRPSSSSSVQLQTSTTNASAATSSSSVFKQQTVDVISSISNKKMPHLFGQSTRFSKRDSNNINMRRLQESDSLSENEAAPEPPPRPDSVSHTEPPPLPPKKQFSDIVIRPRSSTSTAASSTNRYEFLSTATKISVSQRGAGGGDVPPIPLPSRRVGRSDGVYPGPGRPRKPGHTEDDYLAPISSSFSPTMNTMSAEVPPLLPPPTQISTRAPRTQRQQQAIKSQDIYENKLEIMQQQRTKAAVEATPSSILPDITLSQLLTLGIDELAIKLNVPTSKLSTMTLVELTAYLAEFIEKSKPLQSGSKEPSKPQEMTAIFKVNFDQEATFVATFDDNFGEEQSAQQHSAFIANFEQFNEQPTAGAHSSATCATPAVPPADRYAVFREIIDQELQQQQQDTDLLGDMLPEEVEVTATDKLAARKESLVHPSSAIPYVSTFDHEDDSLLSSEPPQAPPPKIDTKITEVVAQAKDRYAALRDIILVENLFDKQATVGQKFEQQPHHLEDFAEFTDELNDEQDLKQYMEHDERTASRCFAGTEATSSALTIEDDDDDDADDDEDGDGGAESSMDSNGGKGGSGGGLRSGRGNALAQDQYEKLSTSTQQLELEKSDRSSNSLTNAKQDNKFLMVSGAKTGLVGSTKDDLEIDDLMQRAISNLSLDSRERLSPATTTPVTMTTATDVATAASSPALVVKSQFNDVSTSPIPVPSLSTHPHSAVTSAQLSPIPVQLTAVSKLIDSATKQISLDKSIAATQPKESWATFDSPKVATTFPTVTIERTKQASRSQRTAARRRSKSPKAITLHLPPPPPSNASPNDTAESPCSSDPRDDGWSKCGRRWPKHDRIGGGGGGSNAPQTSSSSRDLSPWDDEAPQDAYPKQRRGPGGGQQLHTHTDRHGYYMRHARRMNSCDEDYDYDEEFSKRRDHRKLKQGISRSRDNFEFESSNWYHHPQQHPSWSPQDENSPVTVGSRARSFDRSTYERTTYGPPIYDKRGVALPTSTSSYDRRSGNSYDKRKYYREYARPNYDFDGYDETPHPERRGRRDYENIYDVDNRSPMGGYSSKGSRGGDYMYERDRKSFDRESVESFDSATRRRRSFGSGDVYGSLESREEFRERYMGGSSDPKATRSLRKGAMKMSRPTTGEIEYEQDSDINEFHQQQQQRGTRGPPLDTRSLQRPSQLVSIGSSVVGATQQRVRKSSGSSPWDGEEPLPHMGGSSISSVPTVQKSWKRPSSAAESERRLAENRRAAVLAQTPSGSDGEKDRRFRKKQRLRGKDMLPLGATAATRYQSGGSQNVPVHPRDNYDYITYANDDDGDDIDDDDYADEEYEEPPTDEDKFERLNRRRHEMHQRMLESEQRRQHHSLGSGKTSMSKPLSSAPAAKIKYTGSARASDFVEFDDFQTTTSTPRSVVSSSICASAASTGVGTKFSFDDQGGFESDFNQSTSPPPAPAGTASSCNSTPAATTSTTTTPATKSSFRFSNDFSEREKMQHFGSGGPLHQFELGDNISPLPVIEPHVTPTPITQKLRFDDNVKISKFDNDSKSAFEDDFAKAEFDFEKTDQWSADALQAVTSLKKNHIRNSKLQQRQELIKKSESINIFAKKSEDPFEDDEFFNAPEVPALTDEPDDKTKNAVDGGGGKGGGSGNGFRWDNNDNNFAKFDENM